jgi:hypothetical protein
MANDLELSGGELLPFDSSSELRPLAPQFDSTWEHRTDLDTYQHAPQGSRTWFGSALPVGTTQQQIDAVMGQLSGAFMSDFSQLGYPSKYIQCAISFMQANATKAPYQVTPRHGLCLPQEADDYLGHSFANAISELTGSPRAKQQFVTAAITWLAKVSAKFNSQPEGSRDAQGRAPSSSSEAMLARLSEADYNKVIKINEQALVNTMQVLQRRWGEYTFQQNIQIAQDYLNGLPAKDQQYFDQFTTVNGTPWVHLRNTPEFIIAMFDAATGAHNLPKDGAGIARELASIENCMKYERKKYLADPQLQARYRTLLDLKG